MTALLHPRFGPPRQRLDWRHAGHLQLPGLRPDEDVPWNPRQRGPLHRRADRYRDGSRVPARSHLSPLPRYLPAARQLGHHAHVEPVDRCVRVHDEQPGEPDRSERARSVVLVVVPTVGPGGITNLPAPGHESCHKNKVFGHEEAPNDEGIVGPILPSPIRDHIPGGGPNTYLPGWRHDGGFDFEW